MKKLLLAAAVLILLAGIASYNVWHATQDAVVTSPSPLDIGRQQLHVQLEKSARRETEIEKLDWDSITLLRDLVKVHQQRIDKLSANSQAGEILAHDRAAIARIQARIDNLIAQEAAKSQQQQDGAAQPEPKQ
ncbi:MAG TPA: hypothetical protein VGJ21_23410 [Terracidiphilus sp.]|jgi:hypothetical protein